MIRNIKKINLDKVSSLLTKMGIDFKVTSAKTNCGSCLTFWDKQDNMDLSPCNKSCVAGMIGIDSKLSANQFHDVMMSVIK